jgi:hypothetical protein
LKIRIKFESWLQSTLAVRGCRVPLVRRTCQVATQCHPGVVPPRARNHRLPGPPPPLHSAAMAHKSRWSPPHQKFLPCTAPPISNCTRATPLHLPLPLVCNSPPGRRRSHRSWSHRCHHRSYSVTAASELFLTIGSCLSLPPRFPGVASSLTSLHRPSGATADEETLSCRRFPPPQRRVAV